MENKLRCSVVMIAYNAEKYIKEAIDSVLAQTMKDFELIIVNDCSKDSTEEIIKSYWSVAFAWTYCYRHCICLRTVPRKHIFVIYIKTL